MTRSVCLSLLWLLLPLPLAAGQWPATLAWSEPLDLGVPVSGVVTELRVRPGDQVDQGAVLLRLDARPFVAAVAAVSAQVASAQPAFDEAQRERERALELYDRGLISTRERDLAEVAFGEARGRLSTQQAELVRARLDREYSVLKAPYPALVRSVLTAPGQSVVSSLRAEPLLQIARADRMLAVAALPVDDIVGLVPQQKVTVLVQGQRLPGRVEWLGIEPLSGQSKGPLYELAVSFVRGQSGLRPGQTARIESP